MGVGVVLLASMICAVIGERARRSSAHVMIAIEA